MMKFLVFFLIISTGIVKAKDQFIFVGFGELPLMSDSFKPSLGYGRIYSNHEIGLFIQLDDHIKRDEESFNANFGQDSLETSEETVGERLMIQYKYYPSSRYFYFTLGAMYGGNDKEKMTFNNQLRTIGSNQYNTDLTIEVERETSFRPLVGFGLSYPITQNFKLTTDFTIDWFSPVPSPKVKISSSSSISAQDQEVLEQEIKDNYKDNFHNRYHVFNIGLQFSYAF